MRLPTSWATKKRAPHVGVEDEVVIVLFDVQQTLGGADARVVDQNIDGAGLRFRMGDGGFDAVHIGDVQADHARIAPIGLDVGAQLFQFIDSATGQHHRSARLGQSFGELGAQAAGSPGDQGHAPGQIK